MKALCLGAEAQGDFPVIRALENQGRLGVRRKEKSDQRARDRLVASPERSDHPLIADFTLFH